MTRPDDQAPPVTPVAARSIGAALGLAVAFASRMNLVPILMALVYGGTALGLAEGVMIGWKRRLGSTKPVAPSHLRRSMRAFAWFRVAIDVALGCALLVLGVLAVGAVYAVFARWLPSTR